MQKSKKQTKKYCTFIMYSFRSGVTCTFYGRYQLSLYYSVPSDDHFVICNLFNITLTAFHPSLKKVILSSLATTKPCD